MLVTVAICTWNRASLLDKTLTQFRSLRTPRGVTWELLIVNNDCTDNTDDVIARHSGTLPVVRVFEPRPGQGHARNAALRATRGEYLLWTDDDVLVDPDWLVKTLEAFQTLEADLVYGKAEPWWEAEPPRWFSNLFLGHFALVNLGPKLFIIKNRNCSGFGVNHAFRTKTLRSLGGYRSELGFCKGGGGAGEDIDIFFRTFDAGKKIVYAPDAIVRHFIPTARCSKSFHRWRAWSGSAAHLLMLRNESKKQHHLPQMLGVPRYFFRCNIDYVKRYLAGLLRRDKSSAFFFELKLIRLAGLLRQIFLRRRAS